jgi:hypothetical protein
MRYINCGARGPDGQWYRTKKALREALKEHPEKVSFERTSLYDAAEGELTGTTVPEGVTLTVTGPDPYCNRKWYGNVVTKADGSVTFR